MTDEKKRALEELIKEYFCYSKVANTVVECYYYEKPFCPKTCKYSKNLNMKGDSYENNCIDTS